ncbi:universal stress protein [Nocardiopsis eucommiae]|uniref:universal stress protein n=1 Tax=Nocardiopsis eucommiae TaxID=2831970 RepID=UPI003D75BEB7
MTGNILVGTDGSKAARTAADWAIAEARRSGARLTVLCVYDPDAFHRHVVRPASLLEEEARKAVWVTSDLIREVAPEVDVTGEVLPGGSPAREILRGAESSSLVVLGTHGLSSLPGEWLGTVADQVAAHSAVPVVLVRPEPVPEQARDVVVGVDGSPGSAHAVEVALEHAASGRARVRAVWAWTAPESLVPAGSTEEDELRRWRHENLESVLDPLVARVPSVEVVREVRRQHPVSSLLAHPRDTCLVVVGARGEHGFAHLALGGVASGVMHRSIRPVMVVHRPRT